LGRDLAAKRTHKLWQKCYFLAILVTHMCERYNATRGVVQNEIESREKNQFFHHQYEQILRGFCCKILLKIMVKREIIILDVLKTIIFYDINLTLNSK
jgi:uncharacterized membrane protein YiaA